MPLGDPRAGLFVETGATDEIGAIYTVRVSFEQSAGWISMTVKHGMKMLMAKAVR